MARRRGLIDHEAGELAIALAAGDRVLNADGGAAQPVLALTDVESIEVKRLV